MSEQNAGEAIDNRHLEVAITELKRAAFNIGTTCPAGDQVPGGSGPGTRGNALTGGMEK